MYYLSLLGSADLFRLQQDWSTADDLQFNAAPVAGSNNRPGSGGCKGRGSGGYAVSHCLERVPTRAGIARRW